MPRFVILRHETPPGHDRGPHYDLMLEQGGVLRTWSVPELPAIGSTMQAQALVDHRLAYLELEGPLSGNRGSVQRVEEGEYELLEESESMIRLALSGKTLRGRLQLQRTASTATWQLTLNS